MFFSYNTLGYSNRTIGYSNLINIKVIILIQFYSIYKVRMIIHICMVFMSPFICPSG